MNNVRELLKEQLDAAEPSDGDYLKGKTIEEYMASRERPDFDTRSDEEVRQSIERLAKDYLLHKGEKKVYVMEQIDEINRVNMICVWESELEKYENRKLLRMIGKFPVFEGVVEK